MIRRIGEPVAVRTTEPVETVDGTGDPSTFLWRGRLYVVREVLGHWRERQAWWTSGAARAVHGEDSSPAADAGGWQVPVPSGSVPTAATTTAAGTRVALNHECEVWRVEASSGRAFGTGVYDLCRDAPDGPSPTSGPSTGEEDAWQLLRITD